MQVKRRVYPELTDDIIKQLSIEGINTIPEYRGISEAGDDLRGKDA